MFEKLSQLKQALPDFDDVLKNISSKLVEGLPASERERLAGWIQTVREIKSSPDDDSTKRKRLESVPAPKLVMDLLKNHLATLVEAKSITSKETARSVLDTATQLTNFVGMRTFIALNAVGFGMNKLGPRMILSAPFDKILDKLEQALQSRLS